MCSELETVVSEWRSVIAVSLAVRLIEPEKTVHVSMQTHYKHEKDGRRAPGVRGHGSVPLSHSGKIGLHTHTHTYFFPTVTLQITRITF